MSSQLTYPTTSSAHAARSPRRTLSVVVWLALGAAMVGTLVVVALSIDWNGADGGKTTQVAPGHSSPLTRFDGGPNEGTRGALVLQSPGIRFDGGPQEGTRGAIVSPVSPGPAVDAKRFDRGPRAGHGPEVSYSPTNTIAASRFDGGPDEGTRGAIVRSSSSHTIGATRFDGGPDEGTRGAIVRSGSSHTIGATRFDGGPDEGTRGHSG